MRTGGAPPGTADTGLPTPYSGTPDCNTVDDGIALACVRSRLRWKIVRGVRPGAFGEEVD
jgi:hypothetical protein